MENTPQSMMIPASRYGDLEGWEFLGTVHSLGEEAVLNAAPGKQIPEEYRTAKPVCDHCETARHRKDTFIVSKDGQTRRVGRNCLRDFLGHASAEALVRYLYKFKDAEGNRAAWFTGSYPRVGGGTDSKPGPGKKYEVKATVGPHREYRGVKQTSLKRCVFTKEEL